jgi:DHA2 family multidrug resistance protein
MGTGIINLARNIGASVGIATVTTMLERRTQFHMAHLMEHVNPFSPAYHKTLVSLSGGFMAGGSSGPGAANRAQSMVYFMVQRQATMLAFLDNFKMLGVVFFAIIPILLFMKRPKAHGGIPVH